MVTQVEIARRAGIDVSSVNKILNGVEGPKFKKETRALVFRIAKQVGYPVKNRRTKLVYRNALCELIPLEAQADDLALKLGIPVKRVDELKILLYGRP